MRSRKAANEQVAEVARRRLELLSIELAGVRRDLHGGGAGTEAPARPEQPEPEAGRRQADGSAVAGTGAESGASPGTGRPDQIERPAARPLAARPGPQAGGVAGPGRHARRPVGARGRVGGWLLDRVPATLRGRLVMTSAHLAVVAVLVAAALALTSWWVLRSRPSEATVLPTADHGPARAIAPPADEPSPGQPTPAPVAAGGSASSGSAASGSAVASPGPAAAGGGVVVIDVAGKVRRPGIASLPVGSRVADALKAAGGPRKGVDLTSLNLARVLVDGEQVVVGVPVPGGVAASSAADPSSSAPSGGELLVNVNTATQAQLEELPGIGPVTALAILQWRTDNGVFTSVEELLEVSGIGEATLAEIAPFVTI